MPASKDAETHQHDCHSSCQPAVNPKQRCCGGASGFNRPPSAQIICAFWGQLRGQLDADFVAFHSVVRFPPLHEDLCGLLRTSADLTGHALARPVSVSSIPSHGIESEFANVRDRPQDRRSWGANVLQRAHGLTATPWRANSVAGDEGTLVRSDDLRRQLNQCQNSSGVVQLREQPVADANRARSVLVEDWKPLLTGPC